MMVKPLRVYAPDELEPDPAVFASNAALVGNHDEKVRGVIGAWRWKLVSRHGERIKELLNAGYSIDLGGAAAPVGYGAVVVDYLNPLDTPRSLFDVPGQADCIFASHVLEHLVDIDHAVWALFHKLKPGGHLIAQVPAWTNLGLRPGAHPYHEQMFCFAWETNAPDDAIRLDTLLEGAGFTIELKDQLEHNMIVIAAR